MELSLILPDEVASIQFAQTLAFCLTAPLVVYLQGELGAGKTTIVRALLQQLGHVGSVKSPTYTLVEEYVLPQFEVFHFDLYRIKNMNELMNMGFSDYVTPHSLCLVEWPELLTEIVPADLKIQLSVLDKGREVKLMTSKLELYDLLNKALCQLD